MLCGMPPVPAETDVGSVTCFGWDQHQHQQLLLQQQQQDGEQEQAGGAQAHSDSRAEWVRCLALASSSQGSVGGRDSCRGEQQGQRWLYVATNRGLLHRVHLPGGLDACLLACLPASRWAFCLHFCPGELVKCIELTSLLVPDAARRLPPCMLQMPRRGWRSAGSAC
jgi:hypothetical protein